MRVRSYGGRLLVEGQPTSALFAALKQFEGPRRWTSKQALSLTDSGHNREILAKIGITAPKENAAPDLRLKPSRLAFKTEPFAHQLTALEKMRAKEHFALFMEQGTGKTKVCIDRAAELFCEGKITGLLAISKKGVHRQWVESEVPDHCAVDYEAAYWRNKPLEPALLVRGRTLKIFAVNWDGIKSKKGSEAVLAFCKAHSGSLMIVGDESQEIKNYRTDRYKAAERLIQFGSHRVIATGTPIAKNLTDEWAQLKWLNESILGIKYVTAFRGRYCIMGGFENREVIGHKNVDDFNARVAPHVFRVQKTDLGMLPKQYAKWFYDPSSEQRAAMRELKEEAELMFEDGTKITAANAAVILGKLQQITSGFLLREDGTSLQVVAPERNPKLEALQEYLEATPGKVVIWFRFKEEARLIAARLKEIGRSFVEYHGSISDKERTKAVAEFNSKSGAEIFLANAASAGTGLNLQHSQCSDNLYFTNTFNAIERWQSEDRTHRMGVTWPVKYTDLLAKGTIETYVLGNLRGKKSLSDLVLGGLSKFAKGET
jgi:hypothetical protein